MGLTGSPPPASSIDVKDIDITSEAPIETKLQALIRLEVACQLAIDSLPDLPLETGERLRDPIQSNPSAI
jgi:hypothetical protein